MLPIDILFGAGRLGPPHAGGRPPSFEPEYRPFPNEAGRNSRQESLEIPLMIRALALSIGKRILEVGCGRGVALPILARLLRPSRLVGLDADARLLNEARRRLEDAGAAGEVIPGDVRSLPFTDSAFDLVIDFGTCYHIARAGAALGEIARVLVPGGLFVHETRLNQLMSHPFRSFGRRIPWRSEPALERQRAAVLWSARRRCALVPA